MVLSQTEPVASLPATDESAAVHDRLRRLGRKVRKRLGANRAVQPIATGQAEVWAIGQFLDEAECRRLMALIDAIARPSTAYAASDDYGVRTSSTGDFDPREPFIHMLDRRIDTLLGLAHETGEPMQGQRYLAGQQFKPHVDWFPLGSQAWQREKVLGGQRAFTAMVYLNAVEEGGETDFPELDIAIHPLPGTLVVWNNADQDGVPNPHTAHAGNPVIRGAKYIVTKWYRCHAWRR